MLYTWVKYISRSMESYNKMFKICKKQLAWDSIWDEAHLQQLNRQITINHYLSFTSHDDKRGSPGITSLVCTDFLCCGGMKIWCCNHFIWRAHLLCKTPRWLPSLSHVSDYRILWLQARIFQHINGEVVLLEDRLTHSVGFREDGHGSVELQPPGWTMYS